MPKLSQNQPSRKPLRKHRDPVSEQADALFTAASDLRKGDPGRGDLWVRVAVVCCAAVCECLKDVAAAIESKAGAE